MNQQGNVTAKIVNVKDVLILKIKLPAILLAKDGPIQELLRITIWNKQRWGNHSQVQRTKERNGSFIEEELS